MLWSRTSGIAIAALIVTGALVVLVLVGFGVGRPDPPPPAAGQIPAIHPHDGNVALIGAASTTPATSHAVVASAESVLAGRLSARQLAGQRVIYSYTGQTPPASLLALIRHGDAGGVIFFATNFKSRSQFSRAVSELVAANASTHNPARKYPLLLMTDQEGGLVRRLPGAPVLSEKKIGQKEPVSAAEAAARQAGASAAANLRGYRLNVNLAPVLDVYRKSGDFDDQFQRSYSMRPVLASELGASFIKAQQARKVAATAKHFPGLGAAAAKQNTDNVPVTLNVPARTLEGLDEYPYMAAIKAGVKLVMVSWAKYPALDRKLPAGLSPAIVHGQLRDRLKFRGVTITDAIGAGALKAFGSLQNRSLLAARAGMEVIVATQGTATGVLCMDGLESAYRSGKLGATGFKAAVSQILTLRHSLPV